MEPGYREEQKKPAFLLNRVRYPQGDRRNIGNFIFT